MRILLVSLVYSPAWRYGGLVAWAVEHVESLVAAGHEVTVLTSDLGCDPADKGLLGEKNIRGARVLRLPATPALGERSRGLERAVRQEAAKHDVVHVSGFWQWGVATAVQAATSAQKPCVLSPHGGLTHEVWGKRPLAKHLFFLLRGRASLQGASAVHFVSPLELVAARGLPADKPRFALAPSIDDQFWTPDAAEREAVRKEIGLEPNERLLIWAGRVHPVKGLDLLPETLAQLADERWRLLLIGGVENAAEAERVRAAFVAQGLAGRIEWQPAQNREGLRRRFRAADLLVLPSHHESSGIVVLEAAGCGCPALVAEGAGIGPSLAQAQAGWRTPRDAKRWATQIREFCATNEPEQSSLRARANRWAQTHGRAHIAARWANTYTNLLINKSLSSHS